MYGEDRLFVGIGVDPQQLAPLADAGHPLATLALDDPVDLGAEVLRWEIATALAGAALGINPFDQPGVEAAKDVARTALASGVQTVDSRPAHELLVQLTSGDYLEIQGYVDPQGPLVAELEQIRLALRDRYPGLRHWSARRLPGTSRPCGRVTGVPAASTSTTCGR